MKFCLFLGCVAVSILAVASGHTFNSTLDEDWKSWKSHYEKQYTQDEESYRRMVWEDNMRYIRQHNLEHSMGKHTFTVGMNQYGDLTTEEFNELMNGFFQDEADNSTEEDDDKGDGYDEDVDDLESDEFEESDDVMKHAIIDWRQRGLVTPVKNQGPCGSCWAFSVTGAIEGQWAKICKRLVSLSEQNLLDCDRRNYGCNGGYKIYAFQYQNRCKFRKDKIAARIKAIKKVRRGEQNLAKVLKNRGPIAVSLNSHPRSFHLYKQGVYSDPKCTQRRGHAVLVVGFGREDGMNYWLVKNSWGTRWGEKGFIKIAKDRGNLCGIANYAVYPKVTRRMCKTLASSNST